MIKPKNNNAEINKQNKKYKLLFERSPTSIVLINLEGYVLEFNSASEKIFGFNKEEIVDKHFAEFPIYPPGTLESTKILFESVRNGNIFGPKDLKFYNKDRNLIWVNILSTLVKIGKENLIQIIFQDVSDRKQAEERLKETEEKNRLILENVNDLISIMNQDFRFEYINERTFKNLTGFSKDDLINKSVFEFIHPRDIKKAFKVAKNLFKVGEGMEEIRAKDIKGNYYWLETKGKVFKDIDGQIKGLLVSRNITKCKNNERELKELDILKNQFLDQVSHELKTPLTSIYGAIQLINDLYSDEFSKNALDLIEIVKNGSIKLKNLITNLLDLSQIESKKLEFVKEKNDLAKIIRNCVKDLNYFFNEREQEVELKLPKKFQVFVDKSRIERVIINLLSNASKYTPEGGKISIILVKNRHLAEISITDTGIGLTKIDMRKLFKKFSRIKTSLEKGDDKYMESTGLGLYISKRIVELHGGQIWAESEGINKGSTFKIRLPID